MGAAAGRRAPPLPGLLHPAAFQDSRRRPRRAVALGARVRVLAEPATRAADDSPALTMRGPRRATFSMPPPIFSMVARLFGWKYCWRSVRSTDLRRCVFAVVTASVTVQT